MVYKQTTISCLVHVIISVLIPSQKTSKISHYSTPTTSPHYLPPPPKRALGGTDLPHVSPGGPPPGGLQRPGRCATAAAPAARGAAAAAQRLGRHGASAGWKPWENLGKSLENLGKSSKTHGKTIRNHGKMLISPRKQRENHRKIVT